MNQILITKNNNYIFRNTKNYFLMFYVSISICIVMLIYLLSSFLSRFNERNKTNILKSKYSIYSLYSTDNNYTVFRLSNDICIIGLIEIPKINISYPILSNANEDLLKISVCRFSGPLPNRNGNLCIAGHNYKNSLMFSKLDNLKIDDSIYITDLNNTRLEYIVYDKFTVKENNINCTKSNNNVEITLITCNKRNNNERIVIKAKVKG